MFDNICNTLKILEKVKKKLMVQANSARVIRGRPEIDRMHKDQYRNVYDGLLPNYVRAGGAPLRQSPSARNNMGAHPGADRMVSTMGANGIGQADWFLG